MLGIDEQMRVPGRPETVEVRRSQTTIRLSIENGAALIRQVKGNLRPVAAGKSRSGFERNPGQGYRLVRHDRLIDLAESRYEYPLAAEVSKYWVVD
jgi:hypothetical protein